MRNQRSNFNDTVRKYRIMTSESWLWWMEDSVLLKIRGDLLVIVKATYHLVRNVTTRPAGCKFRNAEFADLLVKHNLDLPEKGS